MDSQRNYRDQNKRSRRGDTKRGRQDGSRRERGTQGRDDPGRVRGEDRGDPRGRGETGRGRDHNRGGKRGRQTTERGKPKRRQVRRSIKEAVRSLLEKNEFDLIPISELLQENGLTIENKEELLVMIRNTDYLVLKSGFACKVPRCTEIDVIHAADMYYYINTRRSEFYRYVSMRLGVGRRVVDFSQILKIGWTVQPGKSEIADVIISQSNGNNATVDGILDSLFSMGFWYVERSDVIAILNINRKFINHENIIVSVIEYSREELMEMFFEFWNLRSGSFFGCEDVEDWFEKRLGFPLGVILEGGAKSFVESLGFQVKRITKSILIPTNKASLLIDEMSQNDEGSDSSGDDPDESSLSESLSYSTSEMDETSLDDSMLDDFSNTCIICFENERNCVLIKCGHMAICSQCAKLITDCPICRQPYTDVIIVYNA